MSEDKQNIHVVKYPVSGDKVLTQDGHIVTGVPPESTLVVANERTGRGIAPEEEGGFGVFVPEKKRRLTLIRRGLPTLQVYWIYESGAGLLNGTETFEWDSALGTAQIFFMLPSPEGGSDYCYALELTLLPSRWVIGDEQFFVNEIPSIEEYGLLVKTRWEESTVFGTAYTTRDFLLNPSVDLTELLEIKARLLVIDAEIQTLFTPRGLAWTHIGPTNGDFLHDFCIRWWGDGPVKATDTYYEGQPYPPLPIDELQLIDSASIALVGGQGGTEKEAVVTIDWLGTELTFSIELLLKKYIFTPINVEQEIKFYYTYKWYEGDQVGDPDTQAHPYWKETVWRTVYYVTYDYVGYGEHTNWSPPDTMDENGWNEPDTVMHPTWPMFAVDGVYLYKVEEPTLPEPICESLLDEADIPFTPPPMPPWLQGSDTDTYLFTDPMFPDGFWGKCYDGVPNPCMCIEPYGNPQTINTSYHTLPDETVITSYTRIFNVRIWHALVHNYSLPPEYQIEARPQHQEPEANPYINNEIEKRIQVTIEYEEFEQMLALELEEIEP